MHAGRPAKTAQQHKLEGTYRRDRHAGVTAPEVPKGQPTSPKRLTGEARLEWDRMIQRLETTGTLTLVDDAALYQCCRLFAETEDLARQRDETEATTAKLEKHLSGLKGAELVACVQEVGKLRRLVSRFSVQIRQGRMAQRLFLQEFGLTPATRGHVKKLAEKTTEPDDPFSEFDAPFSVNETTLKRH